MIPPVSCAICQDTQSGAVIKTDCNHEFHRICIERWVNQNNICATCRHPNPLPEREPAIINQPNARIAQAVQPVLPRSEIRTGIDWSEAEEEPLTPRSRDEHFRLIDDILGTPIDMAVERNQNRWIRSAVLSRQISFSFSLAEMIIRASRRNTLLASIGELQRVRSELVSNFQNALSMLRELESRNLTFDCTVVDIRNTIVGSEREIVGRIFYQLYKIHQCEGRSRRDDFDYGRKAFEGIEGFESTTHERIRAVERVIIEIAISELLRVLKWQDSDLCPDSPNERETNIGAVRAILDTITFFQTDVSDHANPAHYLYQIFYEVMSALRLPNINPNDSIYNHNFGRLAFRDEAGPAISPKEKLEAVRRLFVELSIAWNVRPLPLVIQRHSFVHSSPTHVFVPPVVPQPSIIGNDLPTPPPIPNPQFQFSSALPTPTGTRNGDENVASVTCRTQ